MAWYDSFVPSGIKEAAGAVFNPVGYATKKVAGKMGGDKPGAVAFMANPIATMTSDLGEFAGYGLEKAGNLFGGSQFEKGGGAPGALSPYDPSAFPGGAFGGGGSSYDNAVGEQIQRLMGPEGQYAPDITAAVQQDVLGPGYQAAEYGAAGAGVPGAGRVMRGREAVERKGAIISAQNRRQNYIMTQQLAQGYLENAFKNRKLTSDETLGMLEMFTQVGAWAKDTENDAVLKAMPKIMERASKGKTAQEQMHIYITGVMEAQSA